MPTLFALIALIAFTGCATNFEPKPLPADHPASAQAQEAPRAAMKRLITTDELTRTTKAQLARKEVPNHDFQGSGMSHDMGKMDHSQMQGMEMSKPPPVGGPSSQPETIQEVDHSEMKGMPAPSPAPSPANETVEMEMKQTSDEMKRASDELKARSDEAKRTKQASGRSAKSSPAPAIYTCVMHPEVQQGAPGECPKCGMTLVKKKSAAP